MYKIIGADGKEYGPITADQLRQWIAEGRANAQSKILLEGTTNWRPLSEFPELSVGLAGATPSLAGLVTPNKIAAEQVNGPAIGLMVVASLALLFALVNLILMLMGATVFAARDIGQSPQVMNFARGVGGAVGTVIALVIYGLVVFGAIKMKKLENYGLAMTASILAMLPCSLCCLIGLPFGIWSLVVLSKPEVKDAFH